jgi:CRP-like cAMP-binding protein
LRTRRAGLPAEGRQADPEFFVLSVDIFIIIQDKSLERSMIDKQTSYELLKRSILFLADVPEELPEKLFSICRYKEYKKGQMFVSAGEHPLNMGFNLNGVFRLYYIDRKGNDWTKGFSTTGKFITSYSAMVQNRPSFFYIEAVTDSETLVFSYSEWMKIIESDKRWYPVIFKLLQQVYIMKEMREKSFLLEDAAQRYSNFKKQFPDLERSVKLYHIASFLGITPESLSRLRKNEKDQ